MPQIHGLQLDIAWEDKPANFARVNKLVAAAPVAPGDLVVLPEMFATGFSMNAPGIGEPPGGPTEQFLIQLARQHAIHVVAGVVQPGLRQPDKGRNVASVVNPAGTVTARYAKRHPFRYAGETAHYEPGDDRVIFPWAGFHVGVMICYDLRFPEDFRALVRHGVDLFVVIANWPAARAAHWTTLLRARAIENQAFVTGVNRRGRDPKHSYSGDSIVVDPFGNTVAAAGGADDLLSAEIDPATVTRIRREFPFLTDMRED